MRYPTGENRDRVVRAVKLLKRAAHAQDSRSPEFAEELRRSARELEEWLGKEIAT